MSTTPLKAPRHMARMGLLLAAFAVTGAAMVALTFQNTQTRIAENERATLLRTLHELIPAQEHDNDLGADTLMVRDAQALGVSGAVTVYRARRQGQPVAAILTSVAPDGYSGDIKLLVAIRAQGTLAGVRVVAHRETPGLGDFIELRRSEWIKAFDGRSLLDPPPAAWAVKKDGGVFDQATGATITPRAVVKAVRKSLEYFQAHRDTLFGASTPPLGDPHER